MRNPPKLVVTYERRPFNGVADVPTALVSSSAYPPKELLHALALRATVECNQGGPGVARLRVGKELNAYAGKSGDVAVAWIGMEASHGVQLDATVVRMLTFQDRKNRPKVYEHWDAKHNEAMAMLNGLGFKLPSPEFCLGYFNLFFEIKTAESTDLPSNLLDE